MATIADVTVENTPEIDSTTTSEGVVSPPVDNSRNERSVVVSTVGLIVKIPRDRVGFAVPVEIRPTLRKLPNELAFTIEMIDSDLQPYAILLPDDSIITDIKLTPNPESMVINSAKLINRYNTMTRWVEEHWGDEIDTVSFSGSGFSFTANNLPDAPDTGLTVDYRNNTAAFQLFKQLVTFFRFNGCIYQDSGLSENTLGINKQSEDISNSAVDKFVTENPYFEYNHPRRGMLKERLYVKIRFDYVSFLGYFDTFDITEDSNVPFRFTYSAVFKSEKTKYLIG